MITLLEIAERTQTGEKVEEKQWDMTFYRTIADLVKKYEIKFPGGDRFINMDDDLARRAFEAGVELLEKIGIYCITTRRRVALSRDEILMAIAEAPSEILMGEGRDRRVWKQRKVEGNEKLNVCPGHHTPYTEDLAGLVVSNFAQIPRTDFLEGFNFSRVDGREIMGAPMEVYASRRQMGWMREGVRKAGRPGLAIVYYPINTRAEDLICVMDPEHGLRRTDGILLSLLPDLKMEQDMLSAAIVYDEYGSFKLSGSFAIAGGFCGGIEGAVGRATAAEASALELRSQVAMLQKLLSAATPVRRAGMLRPAGAPAPVAAATAAPLTTVEATPTNLAEAGPPPVSESPNRLHAAIAVHTFAGDSEQPPRNAPGGQ